MVKNENIVDFIILFKILTVTFEKKINEKKNIPPNIINYESGNKIISLIIYNFRKLIKVRKGQFKLINLRKRIVV